MLILMSNICVLVMDKNDRCHLVSREMEFGDDVYLAKNNAANA